MSGLGKPFFAVCAGIVLLLPLFASAATCPNLYRSLSFGSRGQDVIELQTFLITQGDLATGNNTGYFGNLTRAAVRKFQCREMSVCSGSEATSGYGAVGPRTRAKIASVCGAGGGAVSVNFTAHPMSGVAPLAVQFSIRNLPLVGTDSGIWYSVDFGDGTQQTLDRWPTDQIQQHTYANVGTHNAKLIRTENPCAKIIDCKRGTSVEYINTVMITVTNSTQAAFDLKTGPHAAQLRQAAANNARTRVSVQLRMPPGAASLGTPNEDLVAIQAAVRSEIDAVIRNHIGDPAALSSVYGITRAIVHPDFAINAMPAEIEKFVADDRVLSIRLDLQVSTN